MPSPQFVTATVRDEPESVPGRNEQFNADPAFEKSPDATPETDSENVNVNAKDEPVDGDEEADANDDTVGANVSYPILKPDDAEFPFPAASLKADPATETDAVPSAFAVGVNVAEYTVADDDANPDNDPPVTDRSPATKSDDASDNVNVTVAV